MDDRQACPSAPELVRAHLRDLAIACLDDAPYAGMCRSLIHQRHPAKQT